MILLWIILCFLSVFLIFKLCSCFVKCFIVDLLLKFVLLNKINNLLFVNLKILLLFLVMMKFIVFFVFSV